MNRIFLSLVCLCIGWGCASPKEQVSGESIEEEITVEEEGTASEEPPLESLELDSSSGVPVKRSEVDLSKEAPSISSDQPAKGDRLVTGWYLITDEPTPVERLLSKTNQHYPIQPDPLLIRSDFTSVQRYQTYAGTSVVMGISMILRPEKKKEFAAITKANTGNALAFILNDQLVYIGKIYGEVTTGIATVTRLDYTPEEIFKLEGEIRNAH